MKFTSETDRLEHPLAKRISSFLWHTVFKFEITDEQMSCMQTGISTLLAQPSTVLWKARRNNSHAAWCCITLGNSEASDDDLIEVASRLKLSSETHLKLAAATGRLSLVEKILNQIPLDASKLAYCVAFNWAASSGHLLVLEYLEQKAPTLIEEMIKIDNYCAFRWAAKDCHLAVLEYLERKAPTHVEAMVKAENYRVFRGVARNGHLAVLKHLEQKTSIQVEVIFKSHGYVAYREVAAHGYVAVLEYFAHKVPKLVESMIISDRYGAFREAARNGHLAVLEYLERRAPKHVKNMIAADSYDAFHSAAYYGHLAVLEHLEKKAPTLVEKMIEPYFYGGFRGAVENDHFMVVNYLLTYANCFAYAEMHGAEYASYVSPFVVTKLTELKAKHTKLTTQNPNVVFDLTDENEIRLCFYLLRNIIRRRDQTLEDDMHFLLQIPAVKALAHLAVTPDEPNELIRLALITGNTEAVAILLNIPAVLALAEQQDFYPSESDGQLDLRALAQNSESSSVDNNDDKRTRLDP